MGIVWQNLRARSVGDSFLAGGGNVEGLKHFIEAKAAYRAARVEQRSIIVNALKEAGFVVKNRGHAGRGETAYTSGGQLHPPYDLSNWLWVQAKRDGVTVMVTLQVLDQDPNSRNVHVLMDRIGVEIAKDGDTTERVVTTRFELPLANPELNDLIDLILSEMGSLG